MSPEQSTVEKCNHQENDKIKRGRRLDIGLGEKFEEIFLLQISNFCFINVDYNILK